MLAIGVNSLFFDLLGNEPRYQEPLWKMNQLPIDKEYEEQRKLNRKMFLQERLLKV